MDNNNVPNIQVQVGNQARPDSSNLTKMSALASVVSLIASGFAPNEGLTLPQKIAVNVAITIIPATICIVAGTVLDHKGMGQGNMQQQRGSNYGGQRPRPTQQRSN